MFTTENRNSLRSKGSRTSRTKYRAASRTEFFAFGRAENGIRAKWSKEGCGQIQRVHAIKRDETLHPSSISSIIQRHFKILSSCLRCNRVFQTTPLKLVAFRLTDNLSDILVRSKLRTDKQTNATLGSFRCGKNCITDRPTVVQISTFYVTGEMKTIHDRIDSNSKNLIYIVCVARNRQYSG